MTILNSHLKKKNFDILTAIDFVKVKKINIIGPCIMSN